MAVNYKLLEADYLGIPDINTALTTAAVPLGTVAKAKDFSSAAFGEAEFIYVKFTGTCAAGDFVLVARGDNTAVQLAGAVKGPVGIAMAAQVTGQFGWVMIRGIHDGANVLSGVTAGSQLYSSATAGRASGTVVATQAINPSYERVVTASGGNVGTVELYWPAVQGAV